ncbi:MAG: Holliday junction resolvase RuvX [Rhodospirillales bacterium]|nr:Holliday junction resolvase RuvX [Rhodospirillales bacterium]
MTVSVLELAALARAVPRGTRLLGIDVGTRTLGLALSDATWTIATPVRTLARTRLAADLRTLSGLVGDLDAGGFIVGLPVQMDGREGPRCQSVRQFVRDLTRAIDLPAAFWDERLSTAAVERTLIGEADLGRKRRKHVVDRAAAAWILQGALDGLRNFAAEPAPDG